MYKEEVIDVPKRYEAFKKINNHEYMTDGKDYAKIMEQEKSKE